MTQELDLFSGVSERESPPQIRMLRLGSAGLAAQAVYALTDLGIPELLKPGARSSGQLAESTGAHAPTLHRLLRFLATLDVLRELPEAHFELTPLGRTLCRRPRSAIADNTLLLGAPFYWAAMGGLLNQVKTGENAFQAAFGTDFFTYLGDHPDVEKVFSAAMASSTDLGIANVLALYDFSPYRHVMDVGGGNGALLKGVLKKYPSLRGTCFDSEAVLRESEADADLADRLCRVTGDFFESVPSGPDLLILRRVLHDWDDERAGRILRTCRRSMERGQHLLVIELSPHHSRNNWAALDLLMMILQNGRERTEEEMRALLSQAGFDAVQVHTSAGPHWIFEAVAV